MRPIYILGVGQTPVSKETDLSIRQLAAGAVRAALADAGIERVEALFLGNMLSGMLSQQQHLGALVADAAGLRGIEAATAEAACSSGAAAVRWGVMAVASGLHDVVMVAGVEKMTHTDRYATTRALATASDWDSEGAKGYNFVSLNAVLMQEYIQRYRVNRSLFAPFAINAHHNALGNPNALFHKEIDAMVYEQSKVVHDPVRLYDASPICNGSAAVVLAAGDAVGKATAGRPAVRIIASAGATDSVGIADRRDRLVLDGVMFSSRRAYAQAGIGPQDIDIFELHDAYTIMSVLSLEGAGFARPGEGLWLGVGGEIGRRGRVPISTMGGLKARGHPVGATGVYQLAELYLQLTEQAGPNQVPNARTAMAQNIGGTGATVLTHILQREE
ncbi:MAG TPA: beta-ketoacyl synthase N-terminal-like domain-containing protein [Anaerolineae bacterium]|nr:beta-ketoacyl synthase N-terminal-like domain-containing protein [Anaerolineae bacterium]HNU04849.1 beta-ketoacyl synthase N-terminal-like domain-containing protein [Anaerolineae bacterium]